MIFFYLPETEITSPAGLVRIPFSRPMKQFERSVGELRFVLWNQVELQTKESAQPTYTQITDLSTLQEAVLEVARNDSVCQEMNERAKTLYGIDILERGASRDSEIQKLITRMFREWAHPMIGNIANSPRTRPMDQASQYMNNWSKFPQMYGVTEEKIEALNSDLGPLERASHDQVRLCMDGVTLARAIVGELTSLGTRRVEKLFALDLCVSKKLHDAQKELIVQELQKFENKKRGMLNTAFNTPDSPAAPWIVGFQKTEYLKYYFNMKDYALAKQWNFYIMLIERAVGVSEDLPGISHEDSYREDLTTFGSMLERWMRFPPVIRCAIILNSFRRLLRDEFQCDALCRRDARYRYSCEQADGRYIYTKSAGDDLLPLFKEERLHVWSWNRDEMHNTTTTYRKHLLPLWAGPSGHTHGHLGFSFACRGAEDIVIAEERMPVSAVILSSLFVLWRLYYDKRISGVHTIAETFEGSIAAMAYISDGEHMIPPPCEADLSAIPFSEPVRDVFFIILECCKKDQGIINPIRLMNTLETFYFDPLPEKNPLEKFQHLKNLLDEKRDTFSKDFDLPRWSLPIKTDGTCIALSSKLQDAVSAAGAAANISLFADKNVLVFKPKTSVKQGIYLFSDNIQAESEFVELYHWLKERSDTGRAFSLSEYYQDLPNTVNGTEVLADLTLYALTDLVFDGFGINFTAEIHTDALFWNTMFPLVEQGCSYLCRCGIGAGPQNRGMIFTADMDISREFSAAGHFHVSLCSLQLRSGIHAADYIAPRMRASGFIGDLQVTLRTDIDGSALYINGEYDDGKILTLAKICSLFGLEEEIRLLPEELSEELFGNLGLAQLSMELNLRSMIPEQIEFVVTAEKAWSVFQDKITLRPYLCFSIRHPFDSLTRAVAFQIDGSWKLGGTLFSTSVSPLSGDICAYMQEGEALDLDALLKCFAPDMDFPDVSINQASVLANYKYGSFEMQLGAAVCLEAEIGDEKLRLSDVTFHIRYSDHVLQALGLGGTLNFGGISFSVNGTYVDTRDWSFSASAYSWEDISLSKLLAHVGDELPAVKGTAGTLPDDCLSLAAGGMGLLYSSKEQELEFGVMLENITVVEGFVIDGVVARLAIGAGKLKCLQLRASFEIAKTVFLLDIDKEEDGFQIAGGTGKGQDLLIGSLLSELADKIAGCCVKLPEALLSFAIHEADFSYTKTEKKAQFSFSLSAGFHGGEAVLSKLFAAGVTIFVGAQKEDDRWEYAFRIDCEVKIGGEHVVICRYIYDFSAPEPVNCLTLEYQEEHAKSGISLCEILSALGAEVIDGSWQFLGEIRLSRASLSYDFEQKRLSGMLKLADGGALEVSIVFGQPMSYRVTIESATVISLKDVPVVGGLAGRFLDDTSALSLRDIVFYVRSEPDQEKLLPAGVALDFQALGKMYRWQIYEKKNLAGQAGEKGLTASGDGSKIKWIEVEKSVACFLLHRIGLGFEGPYLTMELDASLNVKPLTFRLYGAGIGVDLSDFDLKFFISGFGISFQNDMLSIEGKLLKSGADYRGRLLVSTGKISCFAIAEYSEDGSLFAYAAATGQFGGPPAMFITGIALGFAFHKRILMPDLDSVADFPLIAGAMGRIPQDDLPAQLDQFIREERGAKALLAGIRCSSFEVADSFVLLMTSFGTEFELELLGFSDITMPPRCKEGITPIAHARLALKASVRPAEGFFGVEAKLTPESYILSKDCHLTGGFALYMWFGGVHAGDFVITIGGYHPKYLACEKPAHYPDVLPVGFDWKIGKHIDINGSVYFALTPCVLMAGGRLCVTGEWGPLRAYFTAKADFEIGWKPFHYDAEVAITLGGSLHVHVWFVSMTISVELGVGLHIWGPDFSASAHVSIWIVSFDILIAENAKQDAPDVDWQEFCDSFLPGDKTAQNVASDSQSGAQPITISIPEGVIGEIEMDDTSVKVVRPTGAVFSVTSVLPICEATVNGGDSLPLPKAAVAVRPMGSRGEVFHSTISVRVSGSYDATVITQNMPAALWGLAEYKGELVNNVPCGISLATVEPEMTEFPKRQFISLEDLYEKSGIIIEHAFMFQTPAGLPDYTRRGSIAVFSETVNEPKVRQARRQLLDALGVSLSGEISLEKYAANADSYFDEEVLIQAG